MKAIEVQNEGPIEEVVQLVDIPHPSISADEVLIDLIASPINPSDILAMKGLYPSQSSFPKIFGNEGIGLISEIGSDVSNVKVGDKVFLPLGSGTWRTSLVAKSKGLFALPDADPLQLAMVGINPPTAWIMLNDFAELQQGDWIIQNAANSAVGRYVIRLAKLGGIKTVNIVRRQSLVQELEDLGADVVLVDGPSVVADVKKGSDNAKIKLAFDAVAGESSNTLARCLGYKGVMVVYGAMSLDLVKLNGAVLLAKDLTVKSFWLSLWLQNTDRDNVTKLYTELIALIASGNLKAKIAETYVLEDFLKALQHADSGGKDGKVLFVGQKYL